MHTYMYVLHPPCESHKAAAGSRSGHKSKSSGRLLWYDTDCLCAKGRASIGLKPAKAKSEASPSCVQEPALARFEASPSYVQEPARARCEACPG